MAYVLTDGAGTVLAYPYSLPQLRLDNPNTSFPENFTDAQYAEWNVYPVTPTPAPSVNPLTQDLNEGTPVLDGESWEQVWIVTDVPQDVADQRYADAEAQAAAEATRRLQGAEQYYLKAMAAGHGFTDAMAQYIAALQSPQALPGYPLVSEWPQLPEVQLDPANPDLPVSIYTKAQTDAAISGAVGNDSADLVATFDAALNGEAAS